MSNSREELIEVVKWMAGRDTGMSSVAIASHMVTGDCDGSFPYDPADLGRCLRLLRKFPAWKPRIGEMAAYNKAWKWLADNWGILEKSMSDEVGIDWSKGRRAEKTYEIMRRLRLEAA